MIKITTRIIVEGKKPSQIYNWIFYLTPEQYHQWHPNAHIVCERPVNLKVEDTIWFEEVLNGFKISYKWKIIELKTDNSILMKAKFFYPIYLQLSFLPFNKDTEVIHELRIGFSFKGLEKIFDWFVKRFILTPKKVDAIKRHAIEEFKNLENVLEDI